MSDTEKTTTPSKEEEYLAGWKKALADYENLQKEVEKTKKDLGRYANEHFVTELLPVLDNFKSAADHVPEDQKDNSWTQGLMYIKQQLEDVLAKQGVEVIKTIGETFDPTLHETVSEEASEKPQGTILKEMKPGYKMHDKVLFPAKVIISKETTNK